MKSILVGALFVFYLLCSCLGLYLIKSAPEWRSSVFLGGFCLYSAGAVLWLVILRLLPLSFAFPVASGALIICTMITGKMFLGEHISASQLIGAGLIISGIIFTVSR